MNIITNSSSHKRSNITYDVYFVIMNLYTKMTLYILVTKKIIVIELTKIIFEHIMLKFNVSKKVVFDKNLIFINVYWVDICYHMKMKKTIKHRLSLANWRLNRTSKSKSKAFFTSVLLRKANRMNQIFVFDRVRVSK